AGLGLQTIPLVELGYEVTAVDRSEAFVSELSAACPEALTVHADLAKVNEVVRGTFDVAVCMGDTLTHLGSPEEVWALLDAIRSRLSPEGRLLLTFRDYAGAPLTDLDRFLLVRGDSGRVMACCLDYGADKVVVTDIVHELSG